MKKIKLSVATLLIAGASYAQTNVTEWVNTQDSVTFSYAEMWEIVATLDEILEWEQQDIEKAKHNGEDCSCGSYEEQWGSNYWLTLMRNELEVKMQLRSEIK
tara:strand:+ start:1407 stop:1712 length:306 start_codon:yes stop_codon:yes gene_type:complete